MLSRIRSLVMVVALVLILPSCATLQSILALGQVDFSLDRVHQVSLAGVSLDGVRGYEDLGARDILRLGLALSDRRLPLELTIDLRADNPADNPEARLVAMDWTLFLENRETVSGGLGEAVRMASGEATTVPVEARLDLLEFFDGRLEDLVNLAASLAGVEGAPVQLRMEVLPTIETSLGPIRYPRPIVLGAGADG
ncbi:MAG: hypothetical protein EA351_11890 [Gemmatimonadales bacterium]|nr:MAG: hypothetical protein EA351_11890 [Gemmatimonadales bacterium]